MRLAPMIAALVLASTSAQAAVVDIDLNDFFASPGVTVAADGSNADFVESSTDFQVSLVNEPFFGDPNVIVPSVGTSLEFDYNFVEAAGSTDEFFAYVIDDLTGLSAGVAFEFVLDASGSGSVSFDLTSLVGDTLGLAFLLTGLPNDGNFDSTLSISNVQLVTAMGPIPLPASGVLLLGGFAAIGGLRRRRTKT